MGTIFSTYDIRGRAGQSLTVEQAWNAGKAFAEWLTSEGSIIVLKSADADSSIVHAVTEGLLLQGRNVIDGGEGDRETIVSSIKTAHASGGIVVSHDELQDIEIITLFDANGFAITAERGLPAIEELIEAGNFLPAAEKGQLSQQK